MAETCGRTKPKTPAEAGGALWHGGDLDAARRCFPDAPAPWIDLSTGINPWPYPLPPVPPQAWTRLPLASEDAALRTAAAAAYGAPSIDHIAAGPGSQALIQILPRLRPPGRVAVVGPTYAEHARAWALAGHEVTGIGQLEDADADVVVAVNPNNPDGRILPRAVLLDLADRLAARRGWLVVDEAFADLHPQASVVDAARGGLIILRSFGKAYGLAGLRVGFAVSDTVTARRLRDALGPWAVAGPALGIATAALNDRAWLAGMRETLSVSAARLDRALVGLGMTVVGGTSLFRLAEFADAPELYERFGRAGILVRRFAERPDRLRFGLPPDEAAWRRLGKLIVD